MTKFSLVGDVGGTNARFALCETDNGNISQLETFATIDFPSLEAVIKHYLALKRQVIEDACIAIACPVKDDWIEMTNHPWAFSIKAMQKNLGLTHLEVINDFTAVSMAIPMLGYSDVLKLGGDEPVADKPIAIYGAGTGLGVSHLIHVDKRWVTLPGEGGHVDFAPSNEEEDQILNVLRDEMGHVSAERLLSGAGLVNLYRAIVKTEQRIPEMLEPKDISERALADNCGDCRRALAMFCTILGRFGGNLALTLGTFGGVYIAGGIVPRFLEFFKTSDFRMAFEDKGRFRDYVKDIPVYMITHDQPGLLGAGAHLRQTLGSVLKSDLTAHVTGDELDPITL